jgi:hypothetical protein
VRERRCEILIIRGVEPDFRDAVADAEPADIGDQLGISAADPAGGE